MLIKCCVPAWHVCWCLDVTLIKSHGLKESLFFNYIVYDKKLFRWYLKFGMLVFMMDNVRHDHVIVSVNNTDVEK